MSNLDENKVTETQKTQEIGNGSSMMENLNTKTEENKKNLMQTTYESNMQAVQDGIDSKVMENGTLSERRDFMANVASANLYGKQLSTKENPYIVPDIEVDDKTNQIKLTMQEYIPPEKTASVELGSNNKKNQKVMDEMVSKHDKDAQSSLKTLNDYAEGKDVSDSINSVDKDKIDLNDSTTTSKSEKVESKEKDSKDLKDKFSIGAGAVTGVASGAAIGTAINPGIGTAIGAGVGAIGGTTFGKAIGKGVSTLQDGVANTVHKIADSFSDKKESSTSKRAVPLVESRTATVADKTVSKAIKADMKDSKQADRIARAEAMASNVTSSEKSSEAEFV